MALDLYSEMTAYIIRRGLSATKISENMSHDSGKVKGFFSRTIKRFCAEHGIN